MKIRFMKSGVLCAAVAMGLIFAPTAQAASIGGYLTCSTGKVTAYAKGTGVVIASAPGITLQKIDYSAPVSVTAKSTQPTGVWSSSASVALTGYNGYCS